MIQRINSVSTYLKNQFGKKTVKLAIDGGFTCPNRDGTKGTGGCIFCSEDGYMDSTVDEQIKLLSDKWPDACYLAYFQNHSNTYAPVDQLRAKYNEALANPLISGIAIATRPDCIDDEVVDLLAEINKEHFLWVELGLQTIHEKTSKIINRCYDLSVYDEAIEKLNKRGIKVVAHLILGLPGEDEADMTQSVKYVCDSGIWGLKLHLLNVVKGAAMEVQYPDYSSFDSIHQYVELVCNLLEIIPPEITIHRLTGDAPRKILITPWWSYKKRTILNGINNEMAKRGSVQGCKLK